MNIRFSKEIEQALIALIKLIGLRLVENISDQNLLDGAKPIVNELVRINWKF